MSTPAHILQANTEIYKKLVRINQLHYDLIQDMRPDEWHHVQDLYHDMGEVNLRCAIDDEGVSPAEEYEVVAERPVKSTSRSYPIYSAAPLLEDVTSTPYAESSSPLEALVVDDLEIHHAIKACTADELKSQGMRKCSSVQALQNLLEEFT
ncbi:hypothetical protein CC80DRAFT_500119 [Byssothecium circinans]|uniref:Uncharacterized protein n=1 Tax=Byssothecium circinans TaxID=147558 RepID=A0A6A5UDE5_9PLEO|nr:hypothetical protein CC80DRAFT_500119 [Byssothecium circinans]